MAGTPSVGIRRAIVFDDSPMGSPHAQRSVAQERFPSGVAGARGTMLATRYQENPEGFALLSQDDEFLAVLRGIPPAIALSIYDRVNDVRQGMIKNAVFNYFVEGGRFIPERFQDFLQWPLERQRVLLAPDCLPRLFHERGLNPTQKQELARVKEDISYLQKKEALLIQYDQLNHITTTIESKSFGEGEDQITHRTLVRDASRQGTKVLPDPEDTSIQNVDFQLRTLSLMRAIRHAISFKMAKNSEKLTQLPGNKRLTRIQQIYKAQLDALTKIYNETVQAADRYKEIALEKIEVSGTKPQSEQAKFKAKLEMLATTFNTTLIDILHEANLDEGIKDKKGCEKLLRRYEIYSSVLDPALAVETRFTANDKTFIERAVPMTTKTEAQKTSLVEKITPVNRTPNKDDLSFHTAHAPAFQEANCVFKELICTDDRMLGPQARKMIPQTLKNGYIVTFGEYVKGEGGKWRVFTSADQLPHIHAFYRCGIPAYAGEGEYQLSKQPGGRGTVPGTKKRLLTIHATDNIQQLCDEMNRIRRTILASERVDGAVERGIITPEDLRMMLLTSDIGQMGWFAKWFANTIWDINDEHRMSSIIRSIDDIEVTQAGLTSGFGTVIPIMTYRGTVGRKKMVKVAHGTSVRTPYAKIAGDEVIDSSAPGERATVSPLSGEAGKEGWWHYRPRTTSDRITAAGELLAGTMDGVSCASAMDRAGGACEETVKVLAKRWNPTWAPENEAQFRLAHARTFHNPVVAHLANPGHTGMKPESKPRRWFGSHFGEDVDRLLYRPIAAKNKHMPIRKKVMENTSQIACHQYLTERERLKQAISGKGILKEKLDPIMQELDKEYKKNNPADLGHLTDVLVRLNAFVAHPSKENYEKVDSIYKKIRGKKHRWSQFFGAVGMLIGAGLILAGVLLFLPTGGLSSVLSLSGMALLGAAGAAAVGGGLLLAGSSPWALNSGTYDGEHQKAPLLKAMRTGLSVGKHGTYQECCRLTGLPAPVSVSELVQGGSPTLISRTLAAAVDASMAQRTEISPVAGSSGQLGDTFSDGHGEEAYQHAAAGVGGGQPADGEGVPAAARNEAAVVVARTPIGARVAGVFGAVAAAVRQVTPAGRQRAQFGQLVDQLAGPLDPEAEALLRSAAEDPLVLPSQRV